MERIPKKINNLTLNIIKGSERALSVFFEEENVCWEYLDIPNSWFLDDEGFATCFGIVVFKNTNYAVTVTATLIKNENVWETKDPEVIDCHRT